MSMQMKVVKAFKNPFSVLHALKNRVSHFYKLHILKDEFAVAVTEWFRVRGDETLRLDYPLNPESIVFDLGGYKGDFAFIINRKYGCYVFVYEPVKAFYEQCAQRFSDNPKVKCLNYGLSDETCEAFISEENDGSSVVRNRAKKSERIALKEFNEECDRLGVNKIDLLKINVEGSEFFIIPHLLKNGLIRNVNYLQVQFHTFFPNAEALRKGIRAQLEETHVEQWNYPFVWESWRLR